MILCDEDSTAKLRFYAIGICKFLHTYKWIQDAYVSDFFARGHWEHLPQGWVSSLSQLSTNELRWLIDESQNSFSQVLPLSLLSFRACTQTYSADRRPADEIEPNWRNTVYKKDKSCASCSKKEDHSSNHTAFQQLEASNRHTDDIAVHRNSAATIITENHLASSDLRPGLNLMRTCNQNSSEAPKTDTQPVNEDGVLHYFYRKHVKPKKQHEIVNLAKVIQLLSNHIGCNHVVDVGGGLGHLSRLLSFGYGLKVTSVEASDGHAPKANKYDREVDKEIKKKKNQTDCSPQPTISTSLPHHVTSMIYPNMTADDFLAIIQAQSDVGVNDSNYSIENSINDLSERDNSNDTQIYKHSLKNEPENEIASKVSRLNNAKTINKDSSGKALPDSGETNKHHNATVYEISNGIPTNSGTDIDRFPLRLDFCQSEGGKYVTNIFKTDMSVDLTDCDSCNQSSSTTEESCYSDKNENTHKNEPVVSDGDTKMTRSKSSEDFILTGLHACGDLTPTFLRFFINCSTAKGLASVGCCYMKLTTEKSPSECSETDNSSMLGYPMSNFVKSLPGHELSYNSRELACHFADTYSERLRDNTPHLKIHSYRAALEWIANQLCPDFKRSAVQIPAKKTNKMDFESYARLGLRKLGISPDLLTTDLLDSANTMIERWKDVVAFYTLRLSLAPVVETLVLLDRMIFLYEHGLSSILMPIFNPNISPRNFVLISWK